MNRFSRFPLRWSLFIGLFILTFSLTIQHIVNGQGDGENGFRLRLSEGRKNAPPEPTPTIAAPPSSTLPDDATQNLLKRLPAITSAASDKKEFAVRERSLPPPRAGRVSDEAFSPCSRWEVISRPTRRRRPPSSRGSGWGTPSRAANNFGDARPTAASSTFR